MPIAAEPQIRIGSFLKFGFVDFNFESGGKPNKLARIGRAEPQLSEPLIATGFATEGDTSWSSPESEIRKEKKNLRFFFFSTPWSYLSIAGFLETGSTDPICPSELVLWKWALSIGPEVDSFIQNLAIRQDFSAWSAILPTYLALAICLSDANYQSSGRLSSW